MNQAALSLLRIVFKRPALLVTALGLAHRAVLFWRMRPALLAMVAHSPGFQVVQLLPHPIYRAHFWTGMWLLQQTPPIMHIVFRLTLLAGGWPFRTAALLCILQAVISAVTAGLLCGLLIETTRSRAASVFLSLWFVLSTDLVVSEYAFFGQLFYEDLGMLGMLACCRQACRVGEVQGRPAARRALWLGVLAAATALTRSSLSLFPLVLIATGALSWRRRVLAAFILPVLLLQGGWAVKTWIVLGRLTPETSSWAGMNVAKGVFWANQYAPLCRQIADSAVGQYPAWFVQGGRHCRLPFEVSKQEILPPALLARDGAMVARLGGVEPSWNLPSVAAESDAWRAAVAQFTWAHPFLFVQRFAMGYRLVWQRIADHAAQFPWNLLSVAPVDRPFPGLTSRGFAEKQRVRSQTSQGIWFGTISLAPLDGLCILVIHTLLPAMLVIDAWRRWRRHTEFLPPGTRILLSAVAYGLLVFSVAEGGENMRFRLAIEPEILALTACTLRGMEIYLLLLLQKKNILSTVCRSA